jgi:hypothetical protein
MRGRWNLKEDILGPTELDFMDPKIDPGTQEARQPTLQRLVADFCLTRLERCTDKLVGSVSHSPNEETGLFPVQGGGVGESGEVFADLLRIGVILLELDPLGLMRKIDEPEEKAA